MPTSTFISRNATYPLKVIGILSGASIRTRVETGLFRSAYSCISSLPKNPTSANRMGG
jgi:hypothetical protein